MAAILGTDICLPCVTQPIDSSPQHSLSVSLRRTKAGFRGASPAVHGGMTMSTLTRSKAALWRGTRSRSIHHAVLLLFIAALLITPVPIARAGTTRYVATTGADAGNCSNSAA